MTKKMFPFKKIVPQLVILSMITVSPVFAGEPLLLKAFRKVTRPAAGIVEKTIEVSSDIAQAISRAAVKTAEKTAGAYGKTDKRAPDNNMEKR